MRDLDISEVAKRSGFPASALRHYEEKGLIKSIGRRGLRRLFDPSVLTRLTLIAAGQAAGFSLDELHSVLGSKGVPELDREALARKADQIDRTIRQLSALRDGLRHAAVCSAPGHLECPKFRRIMRVAANRPRARRETAVRPVRRRRTNGMAVRRMAS